MLREKYYLPDRPENVDRQDGQLNMGRGTERSKQAIVWAVMKLWSQRPVETYTSSINQL